jgi:hypothetical protein
MKGCQSRFVVSHPFARKKAKGWGTGLLLLGESERMLRRGSRLPTLSPGKRRKDGARGSCCWERAKGCCGEVRGFPPFRQEKGERMGHGALVVGRERKDAAERFVVSHPFAGKKAKGWGTGLLLLGESEKTLRRGSWFPTLSPEKRRKDGARGSCCWERAKGRCGEVRGFPPFRQEKGERMGHGALVVGRERKDAAERFEASHPFARKKAKGWGTGLLLLGESERTLRRGSWFPTLSPERRRKDGARGSCCWERAKRRCGEVRGFPPFRQKKGERMGHGALLEERTVVAASGSLGRAPRGSFRWWRGRRGPAVGRLSVDAL